MDAAYWVGWAVYLIFSLLLFSLLWLPLMRLQSRLLRWGLLWTLIIVLFFPWVSAAISGHFAPSSIVAAFALLDSGLMAALQVMQLQALVWLGGLLIVLLLALIAKIKSKA